MNRKRTYIYLPLILSVVLATGIWLGGMLGDAGGGDGFFASKSSKQKLGRLIDLIDDRYVDEVDTDSIVDVTVNGILEQLDPHSVYIPEAEREQLQDQIRGEFVGIGIRYYVKNDTVAVLSAIKDGPSDIVGITGGDRIVSVDGKLLSPSEKDPAEVLKGTQGSRVMLGVLKPGFKKPVSVPVTRGKVELKSVDLSYMISDDIGYIKINRFSETTQEEFDKAIEELLHAKAKKLILDLRDNPGGILEAAIHVADEFLKDDKLILFQKNRSEIRKDTYATTRGLFEDKQVYVLINEGSASASEIVAGALQDNDRGVIVGRRSFGKGLVQQQISLGDGSAVRLTVSRYYTPTGRSIQRPYDEGRQAYYDEYTRRYENGELQDKSKIEVNDSLKKITPGGNVVYGGGGIIPDIYVPTPDDIMLQKINFFQQNGFADTFINDYLQNGGSYLRDMSYDELLYDYRPPEALLEEFAAYAKRYGTELLIPGYQDELSNLLLASIAGQLHGGSAKQIVLNREDGVLKKTLSLAR